MDLSKLNSNEKMAGIGAVVAIIGSLVSFGAGPYGVLTGIAMLAIIFLPQFSPTTKLPGSKGSLMLVVGGAAAIGAVLTLLAWLPYLGIMGSYFIGGLAGIVGGLLMGWGAWQEFQSEGGKFQLGNPASTAPPPSSELGRSRSRAPGRFPAPLRGTRRPHAGAPAGRVRGAGAARAPGGPISALISPPSASDRRGCGCARSRQLLRPSPAQGARS